MMVGLKGDSNFSIRYFFAIIFQLDIFLPYNGKNAEVRAVSRKSPPHTCNYFFRIHIIVYDVFQK